MPAALITGGAVRIGRAIAESLSADGWDVAIHANSSEHEAGRLAADIMARGGKVAVIIDDLGRHKSQAADETLEHFWTLQNEGQPEAGGGKSC